MRRDEAAKTAATSTLPSPRFPGIRLSVFHDPPTWAMAFLGAALLWLALPPVDGWLLAWVAPVPWILLIRRRELGGRRPYAVLALAGFIFWMAALHWLRLPHWATSFGWMALSFYFAFYVPVFVALSRVAVHRFSIPVALAAPVVWTGLELARAHLLTGMSMASIAHTQYRWLALIQLSDLAGEFGVTFVVVFAAASLARMFPCDGRPFMFRPLLPAAALLLAAITYGEMRIRGNATRPGPTIALIQGSVDTEMRYDPELKGRVFQEYLDLSRRAVAENRQVDLVVWPETMFFTGDAFNHALIIYDEGAPCPPEINGSDAEFQRWLPLAAAGSRSRMADVARQLGTALLIGVDTNYFSRQGIRVMNSAAFVSRDGRLLGRYDKMHLVMFGEYVPLADRFPWLQRLTPLPVSAMPGDRPAAFTLNDVRIAPNICYESVLSHVIRRQVNVLAVEGKEPDILVNLTNDGWFWGSSELDMHLVCGVFRAVECRKPFLIAANTGFSAWIDSDGGLRRQGPRRDRAVLFATPRMDRNRTSWYLRHGDWFSGACLTACGLLGIAGLYGRFWRRNNGGGKGW